MIGRENVWTLKNHGNVLLLVGKSTTIWDLLIPVRRTKSLKEAETRFTTEALVIKETKIGESDRLVTLFTRDYGIIRAFASGAKSIKSRKGAGTSLLTYSSVTILRKKDTYKIYEAVPISIFFGVGSDIVTLTLAQYFCELSNTFALQGEKNDELLRLILNSLYFLTKKKMNLSLIKAITELRTAVISGYMPDLIACTTCGKFEDETMYFDIINGCIYCKECCPEKTTYSLNKTLLSALRHIVYSEFKKLYSFSIPDKDAKILSDITGKYISIQSDYRFATLDFYNSIKE